MNLDPQYIHDYIMRTAHGKNLNEAIEYQDLLKGYYNSEVRTEIRTKQGDLLFQFEGLRLFLEKGRRLAAVDRWAKEKK